MPKSRSPFPSPDKTIRPETSKGTSIREEKVGRLDRICVGAPRLALVLQPYSNHQRYRTGTAVGSNRTNIPSHYTVTFHSTPRGRNEYTLHGEGVRNHDACSVCITTIRVGNRVGDIGPFHDGGDEFGLTLSRLILRALNLRGIGEVSQCPLNAGR